MINYHGQFVALVLFLVVIGIFLFGYVSYSNVSKELRDVTGDVRSAFTAVLFSIISISKHCSKATAKYRKRNLIISKRL